MHASGSGSEVKENFMLNSAEHEISNAPKYNCWHLNIYEQEKNHAQLR